MKKCPSCGLISPNDTRICDCGYSFLTETKQFWPIQARVFIQPTGQEAMKTIKERILLTSGILLHILYSGYWLNREHNYSSKELARFDLLLVGTIAYSIFPVVFSLVCMPIARKINRDGGIVIQVAIALYLGMFLRLINTLLYAIGIFH